MKDRDDNDILFGQMRAWRGLDSLWDGCRFIVGEPFDLTVNVKSFKVLYVDIPGAWKHAGISGYSECQSLINLMNSKLLEESDDPA